MQHGMSLSVQDMIVIMIIGQFVHVVARSPIGRRSNLPLNGFGLSTRVFRFEGDCFAALTAPLAMTLSLAVAQICESIMREEQEMAD